jgi:hypothetical protein
VLFQKHLQWITPVTLLPAWTGAVIRQYPLYLDART